MKFGFFSGDFSDQGLADDGSWKFSPFAILYSCGNIISLFSLTFIIGITKQFKTMFAPVRFWATVVYIILLILTLALSIWLHNFPLSLVLVIVQFGALIWYSASYIPYGRELIRRFFGSCITSI
ncbi:Got1/Sft2-like family-domain-containing protein [Mycotypha africana]|uniref:Got1/Sft2-like family-domain-containing protein n=1 Tax=Mycotypha africana TaxID=64632 RepID=UPI002300DFFD|nr:Got1/Sft2-like family-domain-containing protein [Mycotypha africana]KAI8991658.1 Got1/Sft2-like family-domain-containing protein [Mycotypha africana]